MPCEVGGTFSLVQGVSSSIQQSLELRNRDLSVV